MAERKVVPFDEFYYQLKLTHLFQKQPVFKVIVRRTPAKNSIRIVAFHFLTSIGCQVYPYFINENLLLVCWTSLKCQFYARFMLQILFI
jgi:hypothetical protein